jgi:hypothetical protein
MPIDPWWRMLLVLSILIWLICTWQRRQHPLSGPVAAHLQRLLKPRTPDACPICCQRAAPTDTSSSRPPCRHGRRSKAAAARWAASSRSPSPAPTVSVPTVGLLMRRSMRSKATARTDNANGFRRCAAKRVEPPSAPGAIHRSIVLKPHPSGLRKC